MIPLLIVCGTDLTTDQILLPSLTSPLEQRPTTFDLHLKSLAQSATVLLHPTDRRVL
jgi:hypothetical protein